jgi:hypothetical protein
MTKTNLRKFDYNRVAQIDGRMWHSYYNHRFHKLFWQMLLLLKNQLGLGWLKTLRLAFYSAWAAADYRIHRGNTNNGRIEKNLVKFYKLISDNSTEPFDYAKAGKLELDWWEVHRSSNKNNKQLEDSLAVAVAAMYNESPKKMTRYAHYRAEAMFLPGHTSDKITKTNWVKVEQLLKESWQELFQAVN